MDGVYDLTDFTYYDTGGSSGPTRISERVTIRISCGGTRLEYQADHSLWVTGNMVVTAMVITLAPSGFALNDTVICPQPGYNMFAGPYYTATPGQFAAGQSGYVKVFTRRP